jgi:hypothetical protein
MSARVMDTESDYLFRSGQYDRAIEHLSQKIEKEGESRDELLYLLDLGITQNTAGKYQESIKTFAKAEKIAEIKDYTSLSQEVASVLSNENTKNYKGEDFEKILINVYQLINYACLGENSEALVEARKIDRLLHMMITDGQRKYKQNAFARYISGILHEGSREWNDAYIDYKKVAELEPGFTLIATDLYRSAIKMNARDYAQEVIKKYNLTKEQQELAIKNQRYPEIVVLYQNGISPVKEPNPDYASVPRFKSRHNPVQFSDVWLDGVSVGKTQTLMNVEAVAMENMNEKYGGMIAKRLASTVVKNVAAEVIRKKNETLGQIAYALAWLSEQADLRSWNLLPKDLQVIRIPVQNYRKNTLHTIELKLSNGETLPAKTVQISHPEDQVFVTFRSIPR